MKQLDVVTHDSNVINPFGIHMDGPLQSHMKAEKHAPKTFESGDIGGFGSRGGGGGDLG